MNIKTLEELLESNSFFKTSVLYEDYDGSKNEIIKQTKKDLKLGDTNVDVNIFLFKDESAHVELNLEELTNELEECDCLEEIEYLLLDNDVKNNLKHLLEENTGEDFSGMIFEEVNVVTPEEGIVEIGLSFK